MGLPKPGWSKLPFEPIKPVPANIDQFVVPGGYNWMPLIRWGDPLFADAPAFDIAAQTPEAQARQFGYNSDYLEIIPDKSLKTGVLVNNHEYVNANIMFPSVPAGEVLPPEEVRRRGDIAKMAQGLSVVEISRPGYGDPLVVRPGRPTQPPHHRRDRLRARRARRQEVPS